MASISIPGGNGAPPLVFTVTGTSTTNYAQAFASVLQAASAAGSLTINTLSSGAAQHAQAPATNTVLNEILPPTALDTFTLSTGNEYTLAFAGIPTTVNGSAAGGDTVVAGGNLTYVSEGTTLTANGSVTYNAVGGNNNVDFVAGNNTFNGNGTSGDTITGGAGSDSIYTGIGSGNTVFSGPGTTLINLGDTGTGGDLVYLGDGNAEVVAGSGNDTVAAGTNGQTIFGGSGNLLVNILDNTTATGAAGDVITAGSGTTTVFDSVGGNSIFGGTGALTFVGETGSSVTGFQTDTIVTGAGPTAIFGAAGDNIVFATSPASINNLTVTAGAGNETLNGANASSFNLFANTTDSTSSLVASDQGGNGNGYFVTGTGSESIYGGSGANVFALDTTLAGHGDITIYGWSAADSVSTDAANQSNVDNGTVVNGNYTVTLSDDTTVTFVGITSLTGHII